MIERLLKFNIDLNMRSIFLLTQRDYQLIKYQLRILYLKIERILAIRSKECVLKSQVSYIFENRKNILHYLLGWYIF